MAFTILDQMAQPGPDMFYDPAFRLILETHMNRLRNVNSTRQDIPLELFYQYEGNFHGYLVEIGVPVHLHWLYTRVNGMMNPNEFAAEVRDPLGKEYRPVLIIPSDSMVADIQQFYQSRKF